MKDKENKKGAASGLYICQRIITILLIVGAFFPTFNPTRVAKMISSNVSLFTSAVSYNSLTSEFARAFRMNWVSESSFAVVMIASIILVIGIILLGVGACMSLGNLRMQKTGAQFTLGGSVAETLGLVVTVVSYMLVNSSTDPTKANKILPQIPTAFYGYAVLTAIMLITAIVVFISLPSVDKGEKYEMESKYKLFLMFLPFIALAFVFCYLPLYGWRYAFFDYKSGDTLSMSNFVGFKWFTYLFQNGATRSDIIRVIRNTMAMSALGLITQWIPMAFAIFLCEIKNLTFRRFIQTFTTVPNFISWVLVYALAIAIFSTDGFINTFAKSIGLIAKGADGHNFLMGDHFTWLKMWAWGTWKGVGWSAIIYISGIAGIDQQLYEAATVDGAGRFQKMWNITVPGLLPTFFVLLLMAVAAVLSNGLDQYLVFCTPQNKNHIEVLDLYVYNLGLGSGGSIPLSTVVGMFKSVISVVLLFGANSLSKALRGESIV